MTKKVFISYAWEKDNALHQVWVKKLTDTLRQKGVDAILDIHRLRTGESISGFAEEHIPACDYVVMVLTPSYKEKAQTKGGGVYIEHEIIMGEINDGANLTKYLPILRKGKEKESTPPFFLGKVRINFTDDTTFEQKLEDLYRDIIEQPKHEEPPLGMTPTLSKKTPPNNNLRNIQTEQQQKICNSHLLPWASGIISASFDFLLPDLYIEPIVKTHKRPAVCLLKKFIRKYGSNENIVLTGIPGSGKTTTLRGLFLNSLISDVAANNLTFYFTAKEIIANTNVKSRTLITLINKMYRIGILEKDLSNLELITLYIDGVDEIDPKDFNLLFAFFQHLKSRGMVFWIGVRFDIYARHILNSPERSSLFHEVCELENWKREQAIKFVTTYSKKAKKPHILDRIQKIIDNHKTSHFLENPFKLSLLIFMFSDENYEPSRVAMNDYTLYREFYLQWFTQEQKRKSSANNYKYIFDIHKKIALALYKSRSSIDLHQLNLDAKEMNAVMTDSAIAGLLSYKEHPTGISVEKFQHETITEYLVAETIIESFKENKNTYGLMSIVFNHEVNKFVSNAFEVLNPFEVNTVLNNLSKKYLKLLKEREHASEMLRNQIIYYIGRLPLKSPPDILKFAYENEKKNMSSSAAISAAFGLVILGDDVVEEDYINTLLSDTTCDLVNRSIHLIYYSDAYGEFHTYRDDGLVGWGNTKKAILSRLAENTTRNIRLRLCDIVTLKMFIKSRGTSTFTDDEIRTIENTRIEDKSISTSRNKLLLREKDDLLHSIKSTQHKNPTP